MMKPAKESSESFTPMERLLAAVEGRTPDRLPILVLTKMFGLKQLRLPLDQCLAGPPQDYVRSQWRCVEELGHEALWAFSGLYELNEVLDPTTMRTTEDARLVQRHYLESLEDLKALPGAVVRDQGKIPWVIEGLRQLKALSRNTIPVFGHLCLPFEHAYMLRGSDIYKDVLKAPNLVHRLLEHILDLDLRYAERLIDAGADVIWATNPVVNTELMSRRHYQAFGFSYDRRFFDAMAKKGVMTMFHACGNWSDRVDMVFDVGARIFYLSRHFDLLEAKQRVGTRGAVMGNVPAVDTLLMGTPQHVAEKATRCAKAAGPGGRYILGADCTSPRDTPPDNMAAMFRVAKEFRYVQDQGGAVEFTA
jgi:MtaA/CmuA family methyltransferase